MFVKEDRPSRQLWDRPQLKAVRVPEMGGGADASDELAREASNAGDWENGSQWGSETEGEGSLHSNEEAQRMNRISRADILSEPDVDVGRECADNAREGRCSAAGASVTISNAPQD